LQKTKQVKILVNKISSPHWQIVPKRNVHQKKAVENETKTIDKNRDTPA
jgi:hypothetical protein